MGWEPREGWLPDGELSDPEETRVPDATWEIVPREGVVVGIDWDRGPVLRSAETVGVERSGRSCATDAIGVGGGRGGCGDCEASVKVCAAARVT